MSGVIVYLQVIWYRNDEKYDIRAESNWRLPFVGRVEILI